MCQCAGRRMPELEACRTVEAIETLLSGRLPIRAARTRKRDRHFFLGGNGARLLLHADAICQFDQLLKIPPFFFAHQPSIRTRKINGHESIGRKGRTDNQLRFLKFRQWFGHWASSRGRGFYHEQAQLIVNITSQHRTGTASTGGGKSQKLVKKTIFLPPVKPVLPTALKLRFKFAETALQFPLLLRFFAGLQKVSARGGWFRGAQRIGRARRGAACEHVRLTP